MPYWAPSRYARGLPEAFRMMTSDAKRPASGAHPLLAAAVTLATLLGIAAVWTVANLRLDGLNGWFAAVAAVDAALMLRLAGLAPGRVRAATAALATLGAAALVAFLSAALRTGMMFGMEPSVAVASMSPSFAWTLTLASAGWLDVAWLAASTAAAAWMAR